MLFLRTFDGLALEKDGKPGTGAAGQRARLAILAYIATAGESGVSRDRITAVFWPESDTERAHGSLKQALYSLRRDSHEQELSVGTTMLRLNPDVVRSDVGAFQNAIAGQDWEAAVSNYSGAFLDGIHLSGNVEFERWLDHERARLAQSYASALERLAQRASGTGQSQLAVQWWRQLATTDMLSARIARGYVRALVEAGDRETAIKHALLYEGMVRAELGTEPDPSVKQLANELKTPPAQRLPESVQVTSPQVAVSGSSGTPRSLWSPARLRVAGAAAISALLIVMVAAALRRPSSLISTGVMSPNERLLVADFQVRGTDSTLGPVLASAMRTALEQSGAVNVVSLTTVSEALERMERPRSQPITFDVAREIAMREGIKGIVQGDVSSAGGRSLVGLHLVDASSGNNLATFSEQVTAQKDLIPAIDKLSRALRSKIGESLKQVRATPALERVTTPSLEALRKYTDGMRAAAVEYDPQKSISLLQEAVALDTGFAAAWRTLWAQGINARMGRPFNDSALARAYRHRQRLTARERDEVMASYYWGGPGRDRGKAARAYEAIVARDTSFYSTHLGLIYYYRRDFARAESQFRRLVSTHPEKLVAYDNLLWSLYDQGKFAEADSVMALTKQRFPKSAVASQLSISMLYNKGNIAAYRRALDSISGIPTSELNRFAIEARANLALLNGQLADYWRRRRQAHEMGTGFNNVHPLVDSMDLALNDAELRNQPKRAVLRLEATVPLRKADFPASAWYLEMAGSFSIAGRPDRARAMLAGYTNEVTDTAARRWQRPSVEYALAEAFLAERRFGEAMEHFHNADLLPDGPVGCPICPALNLGRVYDAANKTDSAIVMFESYVQTPFFIRMENDRWDPVYLPRVYERLGQLYEARGDRVKASRHYSKFIELWKNADPELQPRVAEARRRLSRINPGNEVAARVP